MIDHHRPRPRAGWAAASVSLGFAAVAAFLLAVAAVIPYQFNVVSYEAIRYPATHYWPPTVFSVILAVALLYSAWATAVGSGLTQLRSACVMVHPLLLATPLALAPCVGYEPAFWMVFLMILGPGVTAVRIGVRMSVGLEPLGHRLIAPGLLAGGVLALTVLHTLVQINFFDHLMLGHADMGHFTEELKNALAGRGLRSDSFANTRLGWHFVPLLYVLVPLYALVPAPHGLMVCGAFFVHVPALIAYACARKLGGSTLIAFAVGVAWLLVPTQSRFIYSNTYGFQWIYVALPLMSLMLLAYFSGARRWHLMMILLVLLVKETTTAAIFGWGMCLLLFTRQRKFGATVAVVAVVYFVLCAQVLIPHFAATEHYERFSLFGSLGHTPEELLRGAMEQPALVLGRLLRPTGLNFLLMLLVPLGPLCVLGWRISLAAVPALALILLLGNPDYLSIKFWHSAIVLPLLFFSCIAPMGRSVADRVYSGSVVRWLSGHAPMNRESFARAVGLSLVTCTAWSHFFFGFSPLAKSFEVYATTRALREPDPRMETVRRLRAQIPKAKTLLATERLAAHFTDYRRLYTGGRTKAADFVILDLSDRWDQTGLAGRAEHFRRDPAYRAYLREGPIVVFHRRTAVKPEAEPPDLPWNSLESSRRPQ
ncbi:MAG: DUF2079 domain-containing protein [Phycisphaerae bacterium]